MNKELLDYIKQARQKGTKDDVIKSNMVVAGWDPALVEAGLNADPDMPPPPPPPSTPMGQAGQNNGPIAVVHNLSSRGLEYIIMFIGLAVSASSLAFLLHDTVDAMFGARDNGFFFDGFIAYSTAALVVALPIFIVLFLRLKKAELTDPALRLDPSRKRAVQITLVITFLIGLFTLIGYIYSLFNAGTGTDYSGYRSVDLSSSASQVMNLIHALITLVIAGGIFAYYWVDSHRKEK